MHPAIQAADSIVVMIGPGFDLGRLNDHDDYVRTELIEAFRQKKVVMPVLIDTASMPPPAALPSSLRELAYINASRIRQDPDFRRDCERLIAALRSTSNAGGLAHTRPEPARTDAARATRLLTDAERIASSITNKYWKTVALSGVAKALAAADPGRAAWLVADAERITNSIRDKFPKPKASALSNLAKALAATNPARAERIANSITDESWKASALSSVASALAAMSS